MGFVKAFDALTHGGSKAKLDQMAIHMRCKSGSGISSGRLII